MKERPILFSGPMVQAILSGTKTQTRRVVKRQKDGPYFGVDDGRAWQMDEAGQSHPMPCPYGVVGDQLWVRERFAAARQPGLLCKAAEASYVCFPDGSQMFKSGHYHQQTTPVDGCVWPTGWKWSTSIHMPRWAARITLEITGVKVERLQDISEGDATAEGVINDECKVLVTPNTVAPTEGHAAKMFFEMAWGKINGKKHSWESNPWVWAITFKRIAP